MINIMLDIETMGNTHNAPIIQIAACKFNFITGEISDTFCRNVDLEESLKHGFTKDQSTEDWWKKQRQDILSKILSSGEKPEIVFSDFQNFFDADSKIWCHTTFDFPIVQNYLKKFNLKQMTFKGARDIRTLVDLAGIDLNKYDWNKKTHNALDDCRFQVEYCVDAINQIINKVAS